MGSRTGGNKTEIHLVAPLNNGAAARTAKKYPLDSMTENLMGAVRRGLSSSEHIVLCEGTQITLEQTNHPAAGAAAPPSRGQVGIAEFLLGRITPGQRGPEQLLGLVVQRWGWPSQLFPCPQTQHRLLSPLPAPPGALGRATPGTDRQTWQGWWPFLHGHGAVRLSGG